MPQTLVPAETVRDVQAFARTLVASVRARQLYSADHPAAVAAAERMRSALAELVCHAGLEIGVSPKTLMANGEPLAPDQRMAEAAALLNERDILRLRVREVPAHNEVLDFLQLLHFDGNALREQGGPAHAWENFGHRWLELDQLDYDQILREARPGSTADGAGGGGDGGQDDVWTSLVRSMASGQASLESSAQKRLLDIARSAESIRELATQASALQPSDGASLTAAQAATVLATFDRLVSTVRANSPDDLSVAVKNVAKATSELDPALAMRVVGESAESGLGADLTATFGRYFDDGQIARMLARSLAAEGRATGRMAAALSTLAPETDRRDRVLRLARSMNAPAENESGFETAWSTLQEFMDGPADTIYVSDGYSSALEHADSRSHRLTLDIPVELDDWVQTVSSESVRTLSVTLLLDLFALESQSSAITETANDLAALAGDLLLSADFAEALRIATALYRASTAGRTARAHAARLALESIATSESLAEMLPMVGDLEEPQFRDIVRLGEALGASVTRAVVQTYAASPHDEVRLRLREVLKALGEPGVAALGRLAGDEDWPLARAAIQLLGLSGASSAVGLLQPIANGTDPQRAREAVTAMIRLDDPAAAKAVSRILSLGNRDVRAMAVEALAASRDRRASPVLAGLLPQLDLLGKDFALAARTVSALRVVGDDTAVEALAGIFTARRWFAWTRKKTLREAALDTLVRLNSPAANAAVEALTSRGDRQARRLARALQRGTD